MNKVVTIGQVPWSREDMVDKLEEFASLYQKRPIDDNAGGMKSPHMFLAWFALQALAPKVIIESGVWLGQGTWFFEKACPNAELYCIDTNLERIQYKSRQAKYLDRDFSTIDWIHLPKHETVVFFDDHQNAYNRVKTAKWFGFKHMIFEDNYPALQGDCYSLKKIFMHSGFRPSPDSAQSFQYKIKRKAAKLLELEDNSHRVIPPNKVDEKYLRQNLENYFEFPPVFKADRTRWNDPWNDEDYPTPEPLLTSSERKYHNIFMEEATQYTWMCYVKLR